MAPKRPAESYTAPGSNNSPASSSAAAAGKRVKFAPGGAAGSSARTAAAGDDDLDAEDLEEGGAAHKKDKIVTDGYDSDSSAGSDDGFGVGGGRQGKKDGKGGAEGEGDDDDDDMFGDDKEAEGAGVKAKGKQKEFLEMGDIEGQEFGKGEDEEADEDEEEEDYIPEDDLANADDAPRGKRSKEGMGYQLSSFNMQDELAEGRFSADGSYVRNAEDPLATHDTWLDGLSKRAIKAARDSKQRMEDEARRREEAEAKGDEAIAQARDDCLIGLLSLIREGESVTTALGRLGAARKKVVKKKIKTKPSAHDEMEVDDDTTMAPVDEPAPRAEEDPALKKIDRITLLASTLLAQGELEIYDMSYESIIKTLKEEGAVRRDWVPPRDPDIEREATEAATAAREAAASSGRRVLIARPGASVAGAPTATTKYSYKWIVPQEGQPEGQEYGPFPRSELEGWISQGYFGPGAEKIAVKPEGKDVWVTWREAIA